MPEIPEWFVNLLSGMIGFIALGVLFLSFFPMPEERDENVTENRRNQP